MKNKKVFVRIISLELFVFSVLLLTFWLSEIIELPHLIFGTPETPFNLGEAIIETVILLICGTWIVLHTKRLIKKINYLEGFLHVCSFCRKINVDEEWIPLETYIKKSTEAEISHSFCPECYEKHFSEYEKTEER